MEERWSRWIPTSGLGKKYYIESISDTLEGFRVELQLDGGGQRVRVHFPDSVYAYRTTYESFRQELIYDLYEQYGRDFFGDWTFFRVKNSDYLQWLRQQSCSISDCFKFTHYSILATESILDILNPIDPEVTIIG